MDIYPPGSNKPYYDIKKIKDEYERKNKIIVVNKPSYVSIDPSDYPKSYFKTSNQAELRDNSPKIYISNPPKFEFPGNLAFVNMYNIPYNNPYKDYPSRPLISSETKKDLGETIGIAYADSKLGKYIPNIPKLPASVNSFIKGLGYIGTVTTGYSIINADSNAERIATAIGFIVGIAAPLIFGVNPIIGGLIGLAAKYLSEKIIDFFSNRSMTDDDKNGAGILPGVHPGGGFGDGDGGPGGPGGVEFRDVKPIKGIDSPGFILSRTMNIFFNAENDADLIKVFNSFCLPNFQNRRVNEYFETIMREISDGICITDELPFVSLHFNEDHLLYSVMNSYYKNTLIGNILAFMDYFLKGFVNGGFFDIDFIYEWLKMPYKERLTDLSILNQKLISVRKSLKKIGIVNYKSLHDMIDRKKIGNDLSSAFRIIGKLKTIGASENILFPNESFSVEYDIHPSARMQKSLASKDKNSKSFPNIVFNYHQMKEMIKTIMPKVPEFRGFFVALDMITFGIHYNSSLHSNGKEIDTSNSFQNTGKQCDYVKIIPDVFPPLPVSIRKEVDVNIFTWEMIEAMQGTCLNKEIENILMNQKDDFSKNGINEICIKIEELYRNKIYSSIYEDSHYYDDDEIFLNDVLRTLILFFTQDIPKIIKQFASHELSSLRKNVPKVNEEEKDEGKKQIPIESMDVSQIEEECANILLLITNFVKNKLQLMSDRNKKVEEILISQKEKLSNDEKTIKDSNFINSEENQKILEKNRQIIANNENTLNQNIKAKEEFETNNLKFIKVHKEQVNNLSKLLHQFLQNYREIFENKQYYHINYFLQKPTIVTDYDGSSIIGGCTINISKQSQINHITKSAQQISEILTHVKTNSSNQFIECSNGSKGFVINLKINSIPIDGNQLKLLKINDINRQDNVWINNFHQSHFLCLSGACSLLNELSKDQCNEKTKDGKTPIYMACSSGNVSMIDTLCRKGVNFNNSNPNYIKPFLAAIMNENRKAVIYLLLNNSIDIGDINQCTETGITPLHWAIYHNFPEVVELLLKRGASINSTLKLNGMSSVHLACFHNRPECLSLLIKSEGCDFTKSEAGLSPIHVAIAHSLHCSYMLIESEKCDLNEKDSHDYTTYDIAVINGQYEIANLLPKEGKMKDLLKKIKPSSNKEKSNRFLDICKQLYSGNYITVRKLLFKQEIQMKFTDDQKMELIDYACQGRCVEFVEILSKIIKFENYPILPIKSAHYGLLEWIPEIEKYGGNLLAEIDENTIFDESTANSDYDYLNMAFKYVDSVPIHILKRIIKKSIEINDIDVMNVISESIMPEKKFFLLLTGDDIFFSFTKVDAIQIYHKNLDPKYNIKLNSLIESISYNLIDYLVANNEFSHDDLKLSIVKAITIGKNDIAFLIIEKNPLIVDEIIKENSNLLKITKLTNENHIKALNAVKTIVELDFKLPENEKITIFQNSFQNIFDYGDILYGYNSLTWLAGQSIDFLWILKVLPKICLEDFYLDSNAFEINKIELLFQKLISIYEILFDRKNIGFEFIKSLRKLKIDSIKKRGLANEFISAIFNIINTYGFNSFDKNNQNLIHIISKFSTIKKENRQKFIVLFQINETKNLLSSKTKNGETLILLLASSGNYKLLNELRKIGADFNVRDNKGNNVLHKILDGNFTTSNSKVILEISNICKNDPQLILQKNRNDENPFILAAKKGFNGVLGLMSTFYPVKILDSSPKYSILHIAVMYNHPETIRYIVQVLHVDINIKSKDGLTPLHYSSICSSVLSFKELLSLGGNPLIYNNLNNMNAIDYAFKYGSNSMINAAIKTASFNISLSSPKILIYMAMNSEAYKIFEKVLSTMDKSSLFICDSNGNNLISIACISNNRKIVSNLLYTDLDPESISFDGRNSIHVCAENNSIGCSDLILNYIKFNKTIKEVKSILCKCDLNGDLPIHIAIRNGNSGFLVHLLSVYCDKEILSTTNNSEMTPFDEIIKCGLKKEAGILIKYATDILNMTLDEIENLLKPEYKSTFYEFMKSEDFHSGEIIAYNINENLWKYDLESIPESIQMKKDEDNITKIEIFAETLRESGVQIDESIENRLSTIFNTFSFKYILLNILNAKGKLIVNDIISQASKINSLKIRNISCLMFLPKLENGSMMKNLLNKISKLDELNIAEAHPVFSWIENGLISIAETTLSTDLLFYYIDKTIDFISFIKNDKDLFNAIEYPVLPVPIHEFASFIMNFGQQNLISLQINFAHLIHVSNIWRKKYTFSIDFCNRIGNEQYCLLGYAIKNKFDINTIKRVIQITLDLYENPNLDDDLRQLILNHCKMLIEKSKESKTECLKTQISVYILNSMNVIQYYGEEYFKKINKIIPQTSLSTVNEFLSLLSIIGSPTIATIDLIKKGIQSLRNKVDEIERVKFVENRGLTEILNAFKSKQSNFIPYKFAFDGTPVVTINDDEIKLLKTFGQTIINESKIIYTKDQALERGKMFRDNPNIENAAKLVGIVRQVIKETLGINPFVIQCLAVGSLLLHRINKKK